MQLYSLRHTIIASSVLAALSTPTFAASDEAEKASNNIETIVVLGEKVERTLKDTASSVSVIDEEALNSMRHQTFTDAVAEIPNVVVLTGAVPDIRGVSGNGSATGFNSFTGGAKSRVSTLIDGVNEPFVADRSGDSGVWDMQQIEVFRGPQSTINGRNSIGGTIFIKTKDPTFDWEGAARIGYQNQDRFIDTSAMISGPIIEDELAFRVAAQQQDGDTYGGQVEFPANPISFDQNEIKNQRIRSKLLWKPQAIEGFSALLTYVTGKEEGDTGRNYYTGDDPWAYKPLYLRYINTESDTTSLKLDYLINSGFSVDLLVSYMDYKWGFDSYETVAEQESTVQMDQDETTVDGKLNFGLDSEVYHGYIGLAYSKREQDFKSTGAFAYYGDDESTSKAVYGELSYNLSDAFTIIAGGRFEKEEQLRHFNIMFRGSLLSEQLDRDKNIALPKLVLQYAVSDNTSMFASARRGYNSGGGAIAFGTTNEYYYFDQETVNTYELGARSSLADGNVSLAANLFYNNYHGYQAMAPTRKITNIDKAITYGLELEVSAMVSEDLQLNGGLGLLETEIKEAGEAFAGINGNELNSAPNFTASIGARYWLSDAITLGASGQYVGEYYGDITNNSETQAGDYLLTRVNLNYERANWRVAAFLDNALDKKAATLREPAGRGYPDGYAAVVDPRTFGVSVTYTF